MTGYSIRLYGQLKNKIPSGHLFLESATPLTVSELKLKAQSHLAGVDLNPVALGNQDRIFEDTESVPWGEVALLPPVCGG